MKDSKLLDKASDVLNRFTDEKEKQLVKYVLNSMNESKYFEEIHILSDRQIKCRMYNGKEVEVRMAYGSIFADKNSLEVSANISPAPFRMTFSDECDKIAVKYGNDVVYFQGKKEYVGGIEKHITTDFTISVYLNSDISILTKNDIEPDYETSYVYRSSISSSRCTYQHEGGIWINNMETREPADLSDLDSRIILGNQFCQYCHDKYVDWFDASKRNGK